MCKFAQDEMTHQRLQVGSKQSVQQGRAWLGSSRRGTRLFYARSLCLVRKHGNMARTPLAAFFNRPLLRHIGELWHQGKISISGEHSVTRVIRQHPVTALREENPYGQAQAFIACMPGRVS